MHILILTWNGIGDKVLDWGDCTKWTSFDLVGVILSGAKGEPLFKSM